MTDQPTPLEAAVEGIADDGVYVAPGMREHIDAAEEAAIADALAKLDVPLHVIAVPLDSGDMFGGKAGDLIARVHDATGAKGWYVAPAYVYDDGYYLEAASWGVDPGPDGELLGYDRLDVAEQLHPTDLGAGLVELTTALADGTIEERVDAAATVADERNDRYSASDGDGIGTAGIVGLSLLALVAIALVVALTKRGGARIGPVRHVYTLPPSVLDRVRRADAARLAARADRDVLALGDLIEHTDISTATDAWQTALDHYDAARRLLDSATRNGTPGPTPELLDVVGAIVLAGRGADALGAAAAGKAYTPETTCFLNPLHGRAPSARTFDHNGERVTAPVCDECRRALTAGRTPDVLDVLRRGEPVHYFDAGVEPWATTGFGALDPDLITALHSRPPRR